MATSMLSGLTFLENAQFFRAGFADAIQQLAGDPDRSLLKALVTPSAKLGEIVYVDGMKSSDAAVVTAINDTKTRERFEAKADPTNVGNAPGSIYSESVVDSIYDSAGSLYGSYTEFLALQTPHMAVTRQRSLVQNNRIEWGHTFTEESEILEALDLSSNVLRAGMSTIWAKEDAAIIAALNAATVTRQKSDGSGTETVSMPASQAFDVVYGTAPQPNITTKVFAKILQRFERVYLREPIFLVCSPFFKRMVIENSGGTIHSKDFVDSSTYFNGGQLPDIYGVRCIVHPQLEVADESTDEYAYAFTKSGITWNEWKPLTTQIGEAASQRFAKIFWVREWGGAVRSDDYRCLKITVHKANS